MRRTIRRARASSCSIAIELNKLLGKTIERGLTIVPLRMYFKNGRVKVAIALAQGKKTIDKRETIRRREADRETRAAMKGAPGIIAPMKRPVWLIALGIVVAAIVVFYFVRPTARDRRIDLVDAFPNAEQKRAAAGDFSVDRRDDRADSRSARFSPRTRAASSARSAVPDNARLKVSLGLNEDAWTMQGDGVLFRVLGRGQRQPGRTAEP